VRLLKQKREKEKLATKEIFIKKKTFEKLKEKDRQVFSLAFFKLNSEGFTRNQEILTNKTKQIKGKIGENLKLTLIVQFNSDSSVK